jgi:hypothetical protein
MIVFRDLSTVGCEGEYTFDISTDGLTLDAVFPASTFSWCDLNVAVDYDIPIDYAGDFPITSDMTISCPDSTYTDGTHYYQEANETYATVELTAPAP